MLHMTQRNGEDQKMRPVMRIIWSGEEMAQVWQKVIEKQITPARKNL